MYKTYKIFKQNSLFGRKKGKDYKSIVLAQENQIINNLKT